MHTPFVISVGRRIAGAFVLATALAGCVTHGPDGVAYSTRDDSTNVGATTGAGSGVVGGSGGAGTGNSSKEQRGNTPPGVDRDGHGPAAGAIVDPTGAATRGRPY
jgi:hypothetical protein